MTKAKFQKEEDWEYVDGKGIWQEWKNKKTGESTLETHKMTKVSKWDECDHYYNFLPEDSSIQCGKCGKGGKFVWGNMFIKDGKIVEKL